MADRQGIIDKSFHQFFKFIIFPLKFGKDRKNEKMKRAFQLGLLVAQFANNICSFKLS
jgi:hypothetical protein